MRGRGDLTAPMQRLLLSLYQGGSGHRIGGMWVVAGDDDARFQQQTVGAAYDRCLVRITVESRHRRRYTLDLTEIGEAVARGLGRQDHRSVSEAAILLAQEIVAA